MESSMLYYILSIEIIYFNLYFIYYLYLLFDIYYLIFYYILLFNKKLIFVTSHTLSIIIHLILQ